jgi:hypothetical protein
MHQTDKQLLESLDNKLALVRDRTRSVALGYTTGFHLWGEGGTSKTYTVTNTLDSIGARYKVTNSRLTGRGLFDLLDDYPDHIHVLDDVETLLDDKNSHGVLRSALWAQDGAARQVVWQTGTAGRREVTFTGGIVFISNAPLGELPALKALATRVASLRYHPNPDELTALVRHIASQGFEHKGRRLSPEVCREVAEEVLARTSVLSRNLDLRLLVSTLQDRVQFEDGQCEVHWTDLLESRMQGRAVAPKKPLSKVEKGKDVVRSIVHLPRQERLRRWQEETGMSQASLYRRLKDVSQDSREVRN